VRHDQHHQEEVLPATGPGGEEVGERVTDQQTQKRAAERHPQGVDEDPHVDRVAEEPWVVVQAELEIDPAVVGRGQEAEDQDEAEGNDEKGRVPEGRRRLSWWRRQASEPRDATDGQQIFRPP
jgi:hypothetical protein